MKQFAQPDPGAASAGYGGRLDAEQRGNLTVDGIRRVGERGRRSREQVPASAQLEASSQLCAPPKRIEHAPAGCRRDVGVVKIEKQQCLRADTSLCQQPVSDQQLPRRARSIRRAAARVRCAERYLLRLLLGEARLLALQGSGPCRPCRSHLRDSPAGSKHCSRCCRGIGRALDDAEVAHVIRELDDLGPASHDVRPPMHQCAT